MSSEIYSIAGDTANGQVLQPILIDEIINSSITTNLIGIKVNGDVLTITFVSIISGPEKTTLDSVISAHLGISSFDTIGDKNNLTSNTNPTVNDDYNDDYSIASFWINQTTQDAYFLVTGPAGAAVWKNITNDGDVIGPPSSMDKEIVRFNGTGGKTIEGVGRRDYGASATDPVSPTPQAGDKYYNTVINYEMCYDGTRNKWLSVSTFMDGAGRNGNTTANTFYRRWNGMTLAASVGPHVPKGTIVRIGYGTATSVTHTYEVLVGGSVIASLVSGGAASAFNDNINADFNAGIMSSRNSNGSSTTNNFQSVIFYKLRV